MRRTLTGLVALLLAASALAGCSSSSSDSSTSGSGGTQTIDVTFKGDTVSPNGDRVKVHVGEPVMLKIDADKARRDPRALDARAGDLLPRGQEHREDDHRQARDRRRRVAPPREDHRAARGQLSEASTGSTDGGR